MTPNEIKAEFIKLYGGEEKDVRIFYSPGRVNLIGEHTDYNGGFVFPAALTMGTMIALRGTGGKKIRMKATDLPDIVEMDTDNLDNYRDLWWGNYQAGVCVELLKEGYDIVGCDMLYDDTLPHGGGLSSSAAIEVATALAFATLSNEKNGVTEPVDMIKMAFIGQAAEHNYCNVNCGIMDQFASAMGKKDHAIFLDCKKMNYKLVPLKMDGCKLVITNTNKKHSLASEAWQISGVLGSRMTGAGFGGSTVSIVKEEAVDEFKEKVGKNYTEKIGYAPTFYVCDIGDGGREIK